jgi:16S rRNA (uracil1498-N3)-methyltransferase
VLPMLSYVCMNLILIPPENMVPNTNRVLLTGRQIEHVRKVLQATRGSKVRVGLVNGKIGHGVIVSSSGQSIELEVALKCNPPKPTDLTLICGLCRPPALKRILYTASMMGVKRIFLIHSRLVEKSYWKSQVLCDRNISEQLVLGLEQAGDTIMPQVFKRQLFKPFVEDELVTVSAKSTRLLALPDSRRECPRKVRGRVTLIIGPDRGFIPYEIQKLRACGFREVHAGPRLMRSDIAVAALLGRLF